MKVAFVKHDLRNILSLVKDGIWADRPELQCKMHDIQNGCAFYTVALAYWRWSHPPQKPNYSSGHAWQKLLNGGVNWSKFGLTELTPKSLNEKRKK